MPDNPPHVIATRQKADELFGTTVPLGAGSSIASAIRRVEGYDTIAILAASDQPFTISVRESCTEDGTFPQTQLLTSAVVAGVNQIRTRVRPAGEFMQLVLENTGGPMTQLEFCGTGIPQP